MMNGMLSKNLSIHNGDEKHFSSIKDIKTFVANELCDYQHSVLNADSGKENAGSDTADFKIKRLTIFKIIFYNNFYYLGKTRAE